jgi:L-arabinose isomerase
MATTLLPRDLELWLVAGSQHLYGDEILTVVDDHARVIAAALDADEAIPVRVTAKPRLTTPEEVRGFATAANQSARCIGVIAWMHTFSPAKMWISGLRDLQKPLLHLHTQFNRELPWSDIDMDFMNLHQSAHGDREFGHIATRLNLPRAVVVGHWQDGHVAHRIGSWTRATIGLAELRTLKVARFGDNMRHVAVTEGDKVEAEIRLGVSVNTYSVNDLVDVVNGIPNSDVDSLMATYSDEFVLADQLTAGGSKRSSLVEAARIELGLRAFLDAGGHAAFTDTFEDLGGLRQLPGIAAQRMMRDGYGFAGEGDWKTAALVRVMKAMSEGLSGGTSFMEDYTYDFTSGAEAVLGAHMLEVCPSIAATKPTCEVHPLGIGSRDDPVRLVFTAPAGPAIVVALVDLGARFRLLVNPVDVIDPPHPLPKLPVAHALWRPRPNLATAAEAWILTGGPHHTCLSYALGAEHITELAELLRVELVTIDDRTDVVPFRQQLRWNEMFARVGGAI